MFDLDVIKRSKAQFMHISTAKISGIAPNKINNTFVIKCAVVVYYALSIGELASLPKAGS